MTTDELREAWYKAMGEASAHFKEYEKHSDVADKSEELWRESRAVANVVHAKYQASVHADFVKQQKEGI